LREQLRGEAILSHARASLVFFEGAGEADRRLETRVGHEAPEHTRQRRRARRLTRAQREEPPPSGLALEELSGEDVAAQLAQESGHLAVLLVRPKKSLARCLTSH
jgi:hypothetical protein